MENMDFLQYGETKFNEINKYLGNALTLLEYPENEVIEREEELKGLDYLMKRRETPVACLIGDPGTGKTALVETYAKRKYLQGEKTVVLSVNIGALNSGGVHNLKERMENLLPKVKEYEDVLKENDDSVKVMIFIDEVHRIISVFGKGSKEGGDILKPTLARAGQYVNVITATTREEYDRYIAKDGALARRLKTLVINELSSKITKMILKNWLINKIGQSSTDAIDDKVFDRIIRANKQMQSEFSEPAKSIDIIETMLAIHETDDVPMDRSLVDFVFRTSKNVDLEFNIDPSVVVENLKKRVRGQPLVLYTMERMIEMISWQAQGNDISNKPRGTGLLVGTSGVGKTEAVKALTEGIYGDESNLVIFSMTDYDTPGSSDRFRLDLGTTVRHRKSVVILLDEIEKAHRTVRLALLPILDEGIVTYFEEGTDGFLVRQQSSLRGSIVFATSNSGSKMFEDINRYAKELQDISQDKIDDYSNQLKFSTKKLEPIIQRGLEREFPPELLQRFTYTVPFNALNNSTKLDIANKMLAKELKEFMDRGYTISINNAVKWGLGYEEYKANEISMYIVFERMMTNNAGASGARNISKIIKTDIIPELLHKMREYPTLRRFKITTNGRCIFQTTEEAITNGAIEVVPY